MNDFIEVYDLYVLQYIIEPNKIVYYVTSSSFDKLICSSCVHNAQTFLSRADCMKTIDFIKCKYGIEFQIIKLD